MRRKDKKRIKCNICEGTFPHTLKKRDDERCPACVFLLLMSKDKITKTIPTLSKKNYTQKGRRITRNRQKIFYYASEVVLSNEEALKQAYSYEPEFFLESEINTLEHKILKEELRVCIDETLAKLSTRQEVVLKLRFGLDGKGEKTLDEIAKIMKTSKETVKQQESAGIKQLKHPRKNKKLKELVCPPKSYMEIMRTAEKEQREYEWEKAKRIKKEKHLKKYDHSYFRNKRDLYLIEAVKGHTDTSVQRCIGMMMGK